MSGGLAVTLAADLVGYDSLKADDREAALEAWHVTGQAFDARMEQHHGKKLNIVLEASFLATFPSALEAVLCAVELQRDILDQSETVPALRHAPLRVGLIHDGHPSSDGPTSGSFEDYYSARLLTHAEPGGICLSRVAYDEVSQHLQREEESKSEIKIAGSLRQNLRRIWNGLNPADSSVVNINAATLHAQPGSSMLMGIPLDEGNNLVHKIKVFLGSILPIFAGRNSKL